MEGNLGIGVDLAVAALTLAYIGKLLFQSYIFGVNDTSLSMFSFDDGKASLDGQSIARKIRL